MRLSVEGPVAIPGGAVVALCRARLSVGRVGQGVAAAVHKRPLILLVRRRGQTFAFRPTGRAVSPRVAERLWPGILTWLDAAE